MEKCCRYVIEKSVHIQECIQVLVEQLLTGVSLKELFCQKKKKYVEGIVSFRTTEATLILRGVPLLFYTINFVKVWIVSSYAQKIHSIVADQH